MAFKALVYGETGTGKTYSVSSLIPTGQKIRVLAAESNCVSGLEVALRDYDKQVKLGKKPAIAEDQFALMIPSRPKRTAADLVASQGKFIQTALESQFKTADPNRNKYTRYLEILKSTSGFVDNKTGKNYGSIDDWGDDTTLVVDSLTIICEAIQAATVGGKLAISQPEWGVMQKSLQELLRMLTEDFRGNLVLLAHPVKEIDQLLGVTKIYPSNLGQALNNLLPTFFSEVLWSYKKDKTFLWSTQHKQAVTRQTWLPIDDALPQDYALFFK